MASAPRDPAIAGEYDRNAEAYDDAAAFNAMAARRLVASVPPGDYADVLDVGCGTGLAALAMIRRFPVRSVTGLDISQGMLARFREKLAAHPEVRATLVAGDVATAPIQPASADAALCSMALHWFPDRRGAVVGMGRALRPGGVLALVAPGPDHDREYVEVLRRVRPRVPDPVVDIFGQAAQHPDAVEGHLAAAGLQPIDLWVEVRRRRVPPERYMARIRAVGSHVWAELMEPPEQAAMLRRIERALRAASGPRGWEYTFTKLFAVARRPD